MKKWIKQFWMDEEGLGTLEILLILAVLIAVAIAFRKYIITWVNKLLRNMETNMNNNNLEIDVKTPTEG